MWRHAAAALVLVVFAGASGSAQELKSQVIDLISRLPAGVYQRVMVKAAARGAKPVV